MNDLQAQLVDDLVWALGSPAFVEGPDTVGSIDVDRDAIDASRLEAAVGEPPRRVGQYYERLVRFWLDEVARVDLIGAGIQIHDGTRTIGELDFVFRDPAVGGAVTHWEVAVKFFLHDPSRPGSHYPGPNTRDDFETKAAKLFDEQLPRSADFDPAIHVRKALVKGCCFHHPDVAPAESEPDRMAAGCERGTWLRSSQIDQLEATWGSARFVIFDKPFWFTPGRRPRLSFGELSDYLAAHRSRSRAAVMAAIVDPDTDSPTNAMVHRCCFVDGSW